MRFVVIPFALTALVAAGQATEADVAAGKLIEFPHVGIALSLPDGFERRQPIDQTEVFRAVRMDREEPVQSIRLSAFAVGERTTAKDFSSERIRQLEAALAVRDLEVLKETAMPVAGTVGLAQRLRYDYRGEDVEAAGVCFVREKAAEGHRICYLLSVECAAKHVDCLLPALGEVIKSIAFVSIRRPGEAPIGPLGPEITDAQSGYTYSPPLRWFASWMNGVLVTGQLDYLRPESGVDGLPLPQLRVLAVSVAEGTSTKASAAQYRDRIHDLAAKRGLHDRTRLVGERPAKLSKRDAHQFVILQMPETMPTTKPAVTMPTNSGRVSTKPAQTQPVRTTRGDETLAIAQRTLCAPYKGKTFSYSVILLCQTEDGKAAEAMLDKLCEGFSLAEPTSPPATKPATSPAVQK